MLLALGCPLFCLIKGEEGVGGRVLHACPATASGGIASACTMVVMECLELIIPVVCYIPVCCVILVMLT